MLLLDRSIKYAKDVISGKEVTTPEVKIQCQWFLDDLEKQKLALYRYYLDEQKLQIIENLLKLLNFATGFVAEKQVLENLAPFQCFLIVNVFGWRYKDNPLKFKHNDITLFISRKNAKTAIVAIIFILLMLTEQAYSEFYSICLTKELAAEIRKAMKQILEASPALYSKNKTKYFTISKITTGPIECTLTNSFFLARTADSDKNNSIRPSAFVSDEHANFQNKDNFNAMKSGQKSVINPLVFRTTTAYAISNSIMHEDLEYIRKVYNGEYKDENQFALLYYAQKEHLWDDIGMYQSNPLRIEENYDIIRKNRDLATKKPKEKNEYITKDMNNFIENKSEDKYMNMDAFRKCMVDKVDFKGRHVSVGVDLSISTDLTAVSIMDKNNGEYQLFSHGFLPGGKLDERREDIDYKVYEDLGYCTICYKNDGYTIDYELIEKYIRGIGTRFNCIIDYIVSDPFNALEMMQRLSADYNVILIPQTYRSLSSSIKGFRDDIYARKIKYEKNELLEWCTSCAIEVKGKVTEDLLLAKENQHKQRIDLLMASIFAYSQIYLNNNFDVNKYVDENYLDKFYALEGGEK